MRNICENIMKHGDVMCLMFFFFFRKSMTNEVRHFRNTSSNGFFQHPGSLDESFLVLNPDIPKIQYEEPLTER